MPFRNPMFFSKNADGKISKMKEVLKKGAEAPPTVNNFHQSNQTTYGSSKNVHTPKVVQKKEVAPARVNNFEVNKPNMAVSLNQYSAETIMPRNVNEVVPAVNGRAAPELVGKKVSAPTEQTFFPTAEKTSKGRGSARKTPKS